MNRVARCGLWVGLLSAPPVFAQPPEAAVLLTPGALAHADGEQIYWHICQGCHMPDSHGASGAGTYPALAGDPRLESAVFAATTVLLGRRNMPAFGPRPDLHGWDAMLHVDLDDAQIAAVVNYVRSHFGNDYRDPISAGDVAALHLAPGH